MLLDLSDVTFIDCSGLRALLAACEEAERRTCPVRITAVSRQVRRLAELTGTWDCFPLAELARGREGARLAVLPVLYGAILPQHGTVLPRYGDLPSRAEPVAGQCRG